MILAIDTSTDTASLSLYREGKVVKEISWRCHQNQTVELLPRLGSLLKSADLTADDIQTIVVAIGPGSYNGVRVGMSTAKGLALALDIPIIGIGTLEATAYRHAGSRLPICPILGAGRGQVAAALYQMKRYGFEAIKEGYLTTVGELIPSVKKKTLFCGEYIPDIADELLALGQLPEK